MNRLLKIIKNNIFSFILGGIFCSAITVFAVDTIASSMVTYDNTTSHATTTNVQSAIDDLYNGVFNIVSATGSGFSMITHVPAGLSSECLPAGSSECMYRYQGIEDANHNVVNNYICFGTFNKSTCVNDKDTYLYRIIGVNNSGQLKLISYAFKNTGWAWSYDYPVTWDNSNLYKVLNGSNFYNSEKYVPSDDNGVDWHSKIVKSDWHMYYGSAISVESELAAPTVNNYIGLAYYTDFAYAGTASGSDYVWIASNFYGGKSEWMMGSGPSGPYVAGSSGVNFPQYTSYYSMGVGNRPAFYLSSNEKIASGTGTKTDPYIIG